MKKVKASSSTWVLARQKSMVAEVDYWFTCAEWCVLKLFSSQGSVDPNFFVVRTGAVTFYCPYLLI